MCPLVHGYWGPRFPSGAWQSGGVTGVVYYVVGGFDVGPHHFILVYMYAYKECMYYEYVCMYVYVF